MDEPFDTYYDTTEVYDAQARVDEILKSEVWA